MPSTEIGKLIYSIKISRITQRYSTENLSSLIKVRLSTCKLIGLDLILKTLIYRINLQGVLRSAFFQFSSSLLFSLFTFYEFFITFNEAEIFVSLDCFFELSLTHQIQNMLFSGFNRTQVNAYKLIDIVIDILQLLIELILSFKQFLIILFLLNSVLFQGFFQFLFDFAQLLLIISAGIRFEFIFLFF